MTVDSHRMLPTTVSALSRWRPANLVIALSITATASVAEPLPPTDLVAMMITLGCIVVALLVTLAIVLFRRRPSPQKHTAIEPALPTTGDLIFHSAQDSMLVISESGEILTGNPAAEKFFGYAIADLRGKGISALIPPPRQGMHRTSYIQHPSGRELVGITSEGRRVPLDLSVSELPDTGSPRFAVLIRDSTEQLRSKQELEARHQFASTAFDLAPALLLVTDGDGRILRFNRRCEALTQFSEGEIRGQHVWQVFATPANMEASREQLEALLSGEFPAQSASAWNCRDGSVRLISWHHNALRDEYGRLQHVISAGTDLTHVDQLEEGNRESQSLLTAGRVASEIARDFNNMLTAITGYSSLALENLEDSAPARMDIEEIQRASDRGAGITRQLLTFSGNQPRNARPIDLNDVVRHVEQAVRDMAGEGVAVEIALEPGLPKVFADRTLLEECVVHLVANAKEAMPNGGSMQLKTGLHILNRIRTDARPPIGPGSFVSLSVIDTGTGIPPQALPHLFEPFYTTKGPTHANGMGLAMVYGIVRQAEGSIVVHSAPELGSTFSILLPLSADDQNEAPALDDALGEELHGAESVLIAMESDTLRAEVKKILENSGYTVFAARSGDQALQIAHHAAGPIDLLITDVSLPRMTGESLAEAIRERSPLTRHLSVTARPKAETQDTTHVFLLEEPVDAERILLRVRELLEMPSSQ